MIILNDPIFGWVLVFFLVPFMPQLFFLFHSSFNVQPQKSYMCMYALIKTYSRYYIQ